MRAMLSIERTIARKPSQMGNKLNGLERDLKYSMLEKGERESESKKMCARSTYAVRMKNNFFFPSLKAAKVKKRKKSINHFRCFQSLVTYVYVYLFARLV